MKIGYRKRWKDNAVSPVIATILMVAITVVLAAVLYLMVSIIIVPPEKNVNVTLGTQELIKDGKYSIMVTGVSDRLNIEQFTAKLYEDQIEVGILDPLANNGTNGKIASFSDRDGGNTLSIGDVFIIQTEEDHGYELILFYGNGLSGKRNWST